eukprot:scaffold8478_cov129-Ochromonas_danica.AAC.1
MSVKRTPIDIKRIFPDFALMTPTELLEEPPAAAPASIHYKDLLTETTKSLGYPSTASYGQEC